MQLCQTLAWLLKVRSRGVALRQVAPYASGGMNAIVSKHLIGCSRWDAVCALRRVLLWTTQNVLYTLL